MDFLNKYFKFENNITISGLTNELNVFYCLELFKKLNNNLIILTSSLYEANKYYNLFQTYTDKVATFLMDDFVTTIVKAASPELKLTRLNTLDKITTTPHIVITNLMAYLKYLPNKEKFNSLKLQLEVGTKINRGKLVETLAEYGYQRQSITNTTGEYSVRGMVIDVFLIDELHPLRIVFDDNEIESLKYYDEDTQYTTEDIKSIVIKPVDEEVNTSKSTIIDYADGNVVYIDYPQIKASYNNLKEQMVDYISEGLIDDDFICPYETIIPKYSTSLNNFNTLNDLNIKTSTINNFNMDFDALKDAVHNWIASGKIVKFYLSNKNEIKKINEVLKGSNVEIVNKKINHGFIIDKYVVISEFDIENINRNYKYQNNFYGGKKIKNYNDLKLGDYVVHISHGIGIYGGIVTLTKNSIKKDYIKLEYQGNDKIYIPVEKISNIYKYSDKEGTVPKLNRLNSTNWLKTKAYVQKKIEDISRELIDLYKKRATIFSMPYRSYEEEEIFSSSFDYNLTKDQAKAVNDINNDLMSTKPMDRLLCGDVGFGKTEVAMRGIFKAILNNEQVLYLCPTTILSKQQYQVAKERFKDWPIEIGLLNRFTTPKEEKRIIEGLNKGTIDLVIGTHKLLNNKISVKKLGLLVIDEEQRFGVKHKEKIKQIKDNVNVLTLSATPIPRTLKMALSGLRDLSIIDTPPKNRYPVQTYVIDENELIVKDAVYKEISRNGQVFILFNSVENIVSKTTTLRKLMPDVEIRFAHGQMKKEELEDIMEDFNNHKFSVLISTTIIESGIDIPNANTLIVYDADRLGLAQLYQLRGRVGRSDKIAYAYLMYKQNKFLNDDAIKRLQAIKEFTELGSGYRIAMRDLSIRGSGDIFGSNQAGFVDSVGISLYTKMIEDELKKQKGEFVEEDEDKESLISVDTHIDDNYVSDEEIKIEIHQLINQIDSYDKLNDIKNTLIDRFGTVTEEIENYMYEEWFEKIAQKLGIKKVKQTDRIIEIELPEELSKNIKGDKLLYESFSITPKFNLSYHNNKIVITLYYKNLPEHFIKYIVRLLSTL